MLRRHDLKGAHMQPDAGCELPGSLLDLQDAITNSKQIFDRTGSFRATLLLADCTVKGGGIFPCDLGCSPETLRIVEERLRSIGIAIVFFMGDMIRLKRLVHGEQLPLLCDGIKFPSHKAQDVREAVKRDARVASFVGAAIEHEADLDSSQRAGKGNEAQAFVDVPQVTNVLRIGESDVAAVPPANVAPHDLSIELQATRNLKVVDYLNILGDLSKFGLPAKFRKIVAALANSSDEVGFISLEELGGGLDLRPPIYNEIWRETEPALFRMGIVLRTKCTFYREGVNAGKKRKRREFQLAIMPFKQAHVERLKANLCLVLDNTLVGRIYRMAKEFRNRQVYECLVLVAFVSQYAGIGLTAQEIGEVLSIKKEDVDWYLSLNDTTRALSTIKLFFKDEKYMLIRK